MELHQAQFLSSLRLHHPMPALTHAKEIGGIAETRPKQVNREPVINFPAAVICLIILGVLTKLRISFHNTSFRLTLIVHSISEFRMARPISLFA